jgi:hypothetical protein
MLCSLGDGKILITIELNTAWNKKTIISEE